MEVVLTTTGLSSQTKVDFAPKPASSVSTGSSGDAHGSVPAVTLAQDLGVKISSDEERVRMLESAAEEYKNFFPISNTRFTIFRDQSGQFVTRFTNLQTGQISYIPEQDILSFARELRNRAHGHLVNSKV